jgi:hypothetical protein
MDTVTLMRSAIRGLLKVADAELAAELRAALSSGDDYATSAKPMIDWDDEPAREALVDSRAKDAYACLLVLEERENSVLSSPRPPACSPPSSARTSKLVTPSTPSCASLAR